MEETEKFVKTVASKAPLAVNAALECIIAVVDVTVNADPISSQSVASECCYNHVKTAIEREQCSHKNEKSHHSNLLQNQSYAVAIVRYRKACHAGLSHRQQAPC